MQDRLKTQKERYDRDRKRFAEPLVCSPVIIASSVDEAYITRLRNALKEAEETLIIENASVSRLLRCLRVLRHEATLWDYDHLRNMINRAIDGERL